jgi:hypothetical protein
MLLILHRNKINKYKIIFSGQLQAIISLVKIELLRELRKVIVSTSTKHSTVILYMITIINNFDNLFKMF